MLAGIVMNRIHCRVTLHWWSGSVAVIVVVSMAALTILIVAPVELTFAIFGAAYGYLTEFGEVLHSSGAGLWVARKIDGRPDV